MNPLKSFPVSIDSTLQSVCDAVRKIGQVRKDDQTQWTNLQSQFIAGRRGVRVPSSSTDVLDTDAVGDFIVTTSDAYFLINNAGTPEWVRVAVGTF